jgi:hypothetical protein
MIDPTPSRAALVAAAGAALYGERWVAALARDLDINTRTMERMAAAAASGADYRIPDSLLEALHRLVDDRGTALRDVSRLLFRERVAQPD